MQNTINQNTHNEISCGSNTCAKTKAQTLITDLVHAKMLATRQKQQLPNTKFTVVVVAFFPHLGGFGGIV